MMKRSLASALTLGFTTSFAALVGCGSTNSPADLPGEVRSDLQRDMSPAVADADKTALVTDNSAFATTFYKQLADSSKTDNLVFSPHSISTALAMAYAGANGTTESEMASTLHFGLGAKVHPALNWLDLALASRGAGASGKDGQPFRLRVNNALFGEKTFTFEKPFLDTLAINYGAGMQTVDYKNDPDGSRQRINNWVSDKTETKIKDLLAKGAISADTRLVLVNTIYMNAAWQSKFTASATKNEAFAAPSGSVSVPTMHGQSQMNYAELNGDIAIELPFQGGDIAMTFVLPKTDIATFDGALPSGALTQLTQAYKSELVNVSLPKFKLEPGSISLKKELETLGMKTPFSDAADFSKITKTMPITISDVIHKAFIDVGEDGVEAAAATAVVTGEITSAPVDQPKVVKLDRPFFFGIRDVKSGAWLFLGHVVKP